MKSVRNTLEALGNFVLGALLASLPFLLWMAAANAATWERPAGGYTPTNHSANITKYQTDSGLGVAISSAKVDGDLNKAFQGLNDIEARTPPSVSGNSGKFLTNNGSAASWGFVTSSGISSTGADSGANLTADGAGGTSWMAAVPVGTILPFAGPSSSVLPPFVVAAGQSVSRTGTYANLFAVIGTTYGSADSNSFNLPDLRGRSIFGLDNMGGSAASRVTYSGSGISGSALGSVGGSELMQSHTHVLSWNDPGHSHNTSTPSGAPSFGLSGSSGATGGVTTNYGGAFAAVGNTVYANTTGVTATIVAAGSGTAQNMPPAMMLNWIIRY